MGKVATNLTLPKEVKQKGIALAKKAGMSLSTLVGQLLIKEAAREQGLIQDGPAMYVTVNSRSKK